MEQSESIKEIAAALVKVQAVLEGAKKTRDNPFHKARYADLADVWDAARKPLSDNGLSVVQTMAPAEDGKVGIVTTLLHTSGEWIRGILEMPMVKGDPQACGSAITYGRRYCLAAIIGIAPEDDDAEGAMGRGTKDEKKEAPKAPAKSKDARKKADSPTPAPEVKTPVIEEQREQQEKKKVEKGIVDPQKVSATPDMVKDLRGWIYDQKLNENPFMEYLSQITEINGWVVARPFIGKADDGQLTWDKMGKGLHDYWKGSKGALLDGFRDWANKKGVAMVTGTFEGSKPVKQPPEQTGIKFPEGPKDAEE